MPFKKKIKILFVHSSSDLYGSDRCLLEIAQRIDKKKFIPHVILPYKGELDLILEEEGIKVHILDPWVIRKVMFKNSSFFLYFLKFPISVLLLTRLIKKENFDIIYSNTSVIPAAALASFILNKPHIVHVREIFPSILIIKNMYLNFINYFSSKIISISKSAAKDFEKINSSKVNVVYDGVDLARFKSSGKIPSLIKKWKNKKYFIVACIGRLSEMKNQELFLWMAKKTSAKNKNLRFIIMGDIYKGNERYRLKVKNLVTKLKIEDLVLFTGFRRDVDDFIKNVDLVVSTSVKEPLGQVIMEAMAAGKAVLVPKDGGSKELINDSLDGHIYDLQDKYDLVKKILDISKEKNNIGENARKKAFRNFGIERNIKNVEKIILQSLR